MISTPKRIRTEAKTPVTKKRTRVNKKRTIKVNALMPTFHVFELVWAYVKGYPTWPCVIERITAKGKFAVHFFGDYTKAEVSRHNITHFMEGFNQFGHDFGNIKLKKAVEEAKIFLLGGQHTDECFVCKMIALKRDMISKNGI